MLWLFGSGLCALLLLREIARPIIVPKGYDKPDPAPLDWSYIAITAALAILLAWSPVKLWLFERALTQHARVLSGNSKAHVHCNTVFDSFFDPNYLFAGHASFETGRIVFQRGWCERLMDHLAEPEKADRHGIFSVQLFAHEAMHIRGERNEAKTECQAIQRYYRTARMLGIPSQIAARNGMLYYTEWYPQRQGASFSDHYYSPLCAPGNEWDENLPDSTWTVSG